MFHLSSTHGKSWESRLKTFLRKHELQDLLNKDGSLKEKVIFTKDKLKIIDINIWKNKLWNYSGQENDNKKRTYILYKSCLNPESYVKINMVTGLIVAF